MAKPEVKTEVTSTLLKEVTYDPFMEVLSVQFNNGMVYDYIEVTEKTYKELISAPSVGRFFHINIKGKYQFLKRGNVNKPKEEKNVGG